MNCIILFSTTKFITNLFYYNKIIVRVCYALPEPQKDWILMLGSIFSTALKKFKVITYIPIRILSETVGLGKYSLEKFPSTSLALSNSTPFSPV